jgi:ABC-2 type transport system permease protein
MTTMSLPTPAAAAEPMLLRAWWALKNSWVLARRSVARIAREPEQLSDVTIQPVIFVLLFTYVFGSAIHLAGGGSYHQFLISGMFGMTMAGTAPGTAVGLTTDMSTGLIDRFRSLPISRAAVLVGRTMSDLATQVLGLVVLVATGLAVGWRMERGIGDALIAAGLSLLIAFAMTWVGACAGMLLRSPETAQALGFIFFLPLSFVSNAFVPTQGMPAWLREFANWNPLSAVAAACRNLFGGNVATPDAWPMQHPELAVLIWSVGLIAVFAPTAIYLYRRKVLR